MLNNQRVVPMKNQVLKIPKKTNPQGLEHVPSHHHCQCVCTGLPRPMGHQLIGRCPMAHHMIHCSNRERCVPTPQLPWSPCLEFRTDCFGDRQDCHGYSWMRAFIYKEELGPKSKDWEVIGNERIFGNFVSLSRCYGCPT